ncbi:ATP-dependent RNA helicase ddx51 [Branchiostoma belcheri]|nr:ATP-dependent RNA helicase ddx51 [Branchiostoma belcheri]
MALFTVNRYLGEEEDVATYSSSRGLHGNQSANDILEKLHKDARLRQEKSIQNGPGTSQSSIHTAVDKLAKDEPMELKKRRQEVQELSSGKKKFKPKKIVEETNMKETEGEMLTSQKRKVSSKTKSKRNEKTLVPKSTEMSKSKKPNKDKQITSMAEVNDPISSEPLAMNNDIDSTMVNGKKKKTDKTKTVKEQKRKKTTKQVEENDGIQVEVSQTSVKEAAMGKKKKTQLTEKGEAKNGEETTPKMDKLNKAKVKSKKAKSEETTSMDDANTSRKQSEQNKKAKRDNSIDNDARDTITEDMDYEQQEILGEVQKSKAEKVHRKLPDWLADPSVIQNDIQSNLVPIEDTAYIGEFLRNKLKENGVENLFPVQHQVIPAILEDAQDGTIMGRAGFRPSDICVSAPTGSGKTLAFVIPVVQALLQRVVCEVRALVVLPTKDLAVQIYKVFNHYTSGSRLKVANCSGQKSLAVERNALVRESRGVYQSIADIVVATPGRLVDHVEKTAGFSLRHLRYLVIDEADRMLDQIKQDWLAKVTRAVYEGQGSEVKPGIPMSLWAGVLGGRTEPGPLTAANAAKMQQPLQKLLFSATLSQNPEKLQQLNLFHPRLFTSVVRHRQRKQETATTGALQDKGTFVGKFTTPAGLKEYTVSCTAADKPLVVLHLLLNQKFQHVLCFTGSLESTHRLYLLAKLFGGVTVAEFSSNLAPERRTKILTKFRTGKIQLIVCSDAMARGMDVEGVEVVISYDVPPYVKTYIHRVGRTARAGKEGTAFSLVLQEEEKRFRRMLKQAGKDEPQPWSLTGTDLQPLVPRYQKTLQRLQKKLKVEAKTK